MKNITLSLAITLSALMSANSYAAESKVYTYTSKGVVNIQITGESARVISESISRAHNSSTKTGSLVINEISGKNISCRLVQGRASCKLAIDENGNMNLSSADATKFSSETGTSTSTQKKNGATVSLSGKVADLLLKSMTGVNNTGTMTITKDSGDIVCSRVKEFNTNESSSSCVFNLDVYGASSSAK